MRASRVRMRGLAWLVVAAIGMARPAYADPPPVAEGAASLENGRQAWEKKQFDAAELFYKSALDQGQLAPRDVLEAYVRLGTARAVQNKKELARVAFRQAALIDAHFKVPREGGKKALAAAKLAKKDEARLGSVSLRAKMPKEVSSQDGFGVDASLDPKHAAVMARIGIDTRDPTSGKHYSHSEVALPTVHFDVPADATPPGATLIVRVDALDAHDNRVASREQRIQVRDDAPPPPAPIASLPVKPAPEPAPAPTVKFGPTDEIPPVKKKEQKNDESGGFWSSPWPWVIGGVAIAAGGAATYYYVIRPSDDVAVGSPNVSTR